MERYVLLRGKVVGKWYDFDRKAHYHIVAAIKESENDIKEYDISINIGSIFENSDEFYSSNLQVYYDNNYTYNNKILKEMLLQKPGITIGKKYLRMELFPREKMKIMKGIDRENAFLTGIIERHVLEALNNDINEIFVFGRLYDNKKGIHDVHMNQASTGRYRSSDAPYSDGGVFFYNSESKIWTAIFIAFTTQSVSR